MKKLITKISGLIRLFRIELPFTAGICTVVGEILTLNAFPSLQQMTFGFLAVFLVSASALILNDYFDVESDRINAPERPIPSGLVTKGQVLILFGLASLGGFIFGALNDPQALGVLILVWIVGVLYNWRFKHFGLLGNLMVRFSMGLMFIFSGAVAGRVWQPQRLHHSTNGSNNLYSSDHKKYKPLTLIKGRAILTDFSVQPHLS